MTSRDGLNWQRPLRQPVIPAGEPGSEAEGGAYAGCGLVSPDPGAWSLPYSPRRCSHNQVFFDNSRPESGVLTASWRQDGFVSLEAESLGGCSTLILAFSGSRLGAQRLDPIRRGNPGGVGRRLQGQPQDPCSGHSRPRFRRLRSHLGRPSRPHRHLEGAGGPVRLERPAGPVAHSDAPGQALLPSLRLTATMFNPHFSPGRWNHDEKLFIFNMFIGLNLKELQVESALAALWLVLFPSARTCSLDRSDRYALRSRAHAEEKFLRHHHAPR